MNKEEIDTDSTDNPVCPHCGFVDYDTEMYYDDESGGSGRERCTECGGWFTWYFEVSPHFWTEKVDWVNEWEQYNKFQVQMFKL